MTDQETRALSKEEELDALAHLLEEHGMIDLAWNRRAWICTEGHHLRNYRRLRKGALCPEKRDGVRCAGRVIHPPLNWFSVEDTLWTIAQRRQWTVTLTSYSGGIGYQWEVGTGHKGSSTSKTEAALIALTKALRYESRKG